MDDRDYFIHGPRQLCVAGLIMSKPLTGRVQRRRGVTFARRLTRADGSFAGTVYAMVRVQRFLDLFSTLDIGRQGSVTVRDADYEVVARYPALSGDANAGGLKMPTRQFLEAVRVNPNSGNFIAAATIDNIVRAYAFRRLAKHPLYIIVGLAIDDILREWWIEAFAMGGMVAFFLLTTIASARMIRRTWLSQKQAMQEAQVANARLEVDPAQFADRSCHLRSRSDRAIGQQDDEGDVQGRRR